jgi:hypothetical protein
MDNLEQAYYLFLNPLGAFGPSNFFFARLGSLRPNNLNSSVYFRIYWPSFCIGLCELSIANSFGSPQ